LSVLIVFCSRLGTAHVTKVIVPSIMHKRRMKKELAGTDRELSVAEKEYTLDKYDEMLGTLSAYASLSIQFGYATLFVIALPMAPFLAFLTNYYQIGVEAKQMMFHNQRPFPSGAQDIGSWQTIFETVGLAAVFTNAALITWTVEDHFATESAWQKMLVFIAYQYFVFGILSFVKWAVDDVPPDVNLQLKRQEFLVSKVIYHCPDEADERESMVLAGVMGIKFRIEQADKPGKEADKPGVA